MKRMLVSGLLLGAAVATPSFAADYYGDVLPVMERKCVTCHADASVSFSFENAEQAYAYRQAIVSAVAERRMPPWLAQSGHQEYADDLSLTREEMRLFADWANSGFPKGQPGTRVAAEPVYEPFSADLVVDIMPGEPYQPNPDRLDDYRCFVVDWPGSEPAYVTGFRARPGNLKVAHHLVLFAANPDVAGRFKALEREEDGKGYQCFGGAVPDRFTDEAARAAYEQQHPDGIRELSKGSFWLAHWAPGMDGYAFPAGTGIRVEPGMALIVQMHYYSGHAAGEVDSNTRMEFTLSDSAPRPAFYLPLTRDEWLYGEQNGSMVIPPGERRSYEVSVDLESLRRLASAVTHIPPDRIDALEIHSANLHMHSYGSSGIISLIDRHGREETLLSVPRWNLGWQRDFAFVKPKVFGREVLSDTRIRVQCTYENPNEEPVFGGFGSDEEMCFNFSYVAVVPGNEDRVNDAR